MTYEDREDFSRMIDAHKRASGLAFAAGLFISMEVVTRHAYFRGMAIGWKVASWFALGWGLR